MILIHFKLTIFLIGQFIVLSSTVPISPCPEMFEYETDEASGIFSLFNAKPRHDINIEIKLFVPSKLNTFKGSIELIGSPTQVVQDIKYNRPVRYRVKFPLDDPLPQVISIKYNGDLICSGSITERRFHYTNINLGINWSLGDNASEKLEPVQTTTYRTTQRVTTPRTTKAYSTSSETSRQTTTSSDFILLLEPSIAKFEESANYQNTAKIPQYQDPDEHEQDDEDLSHEQDDDVVCGIPKVPNFSSRIVGGTTSPRGQFPWIVAYFDVNKKGIPQFLCGGSLVSHHHVVSAAHCIQEKSSTKIRQASNAILYIGKSNLETDQERGHQKVGAKKIIMHPEYDAFESLYDADISIFVLNRKISYSEFIRPICLWNLNGYLDDIVNEYGTIVGWGTDEDGDLNLNLPKMSKTPVVSQEMCLREPGFSLITSERTFCAGRKELGEGPCNGDSGGGFMLKSAGRWLLRGIIAASMSDPDTNACNVNQYAIFTDIVPFKKWIRKIIKREI